MHFKTKVPIIESLYHRILAKWPNSRGLKKVVATDLDEKMRNLRS